MNKALATVGAQQVFDHRMIARREFAIRADGRNECVFVTFTDPIVRDATLIRAFTAAVAQHQNGTVAPGSASPVDWRGLGWACRADHDNLLAGLRRDKAAWSEHPLCGRFDEYVNAEMDREGIPHRPPYSDHQLDALDRIVQRAPAVVAQDVAAEGIAA